MDEWKQMSMALNELRQFLNKLRQKTIRDNE
jgi:hypothetical protein